MLGSKGTTPQALIAIAMETSVARSKMEGPPLSTCSHSLCPLGSQPRSLRNIYL